MEIVLSITGRNLRIFLRDRGSVFFSLLGALIVFLLYALFLADLQTSSIAASVPGVELDVVRAFIDTWMFAGIVAMTSITTSLGALGVFVEDAATGRFRDFLVSPIRRWQLVLGYLLATVIVAFLLTMAVFAVSIAYLFLVDDVVIAGPQLARSVLWIALSCLAFAAPWAFVASFIRTTGAFSALATLVGTVVGFLAGAFIAIGLFPEPARDLVSILPFAQSAMLMRHELTEESLRVLVGDDDAAASAISEFYGISLMVGESSIPMPLVTGLLLAYSLVFAALGTWRIRSRID